MLTKNHDEALQEFIWNATKLSNKGGPETSGAPTLPIDKNTAKSDQQHGMEGLKVLGQLIVSNGYVYAFLSSLSGLF